MASQHTTLKCMEDTTLFPQYIKVHFHFALNIYYSTLRESVKHPHTTKAHMHAPTHIHLHTTHTAPASAQPVQCRHLHTLPRSTPLHTQHAEGCLREQGLRDTHRFSLAHTVPLSYLLRHSLVAPMCDVYHYTPCVMYATTPHV